jgi:hypothetical protein
MLVRVRQASIYCIWALALVVPRAAWSEVRIDNRGGCFETASLRQRLEDVLLEFSGRPRVDLGVSVASSRARSGASSVALIVRAPWGETLLERWYELTPADCRSATKLLALVLERFLSGFPAMKWRALARKAEKMPRGSPRLLEVSLHAAASSEWIPTGAAADLGLAVEYGSVRHRFGVSAGAKTTLPRTLGEGQVMEIPLLVGLRWRYAAYSWQPAVEVRAGPALVKGFGYDINYLRWVPWLDVLATVERRWRHVALGLQLTVTPLRHQVLTEDEKDSEGLPIVSLGLRLTVPIHIRNL